MAAQNFVNIGKKERCDFCIPAAMRTYYSKSYYLGSGRFGIVYGLQHANRRRKDIAVKKFIKPFEFERRAQRCYRELQLLSELAHENIVTIKYTFTTDTSMNVLDNVYLVTEYCGHDLNAILCQEKEDKHLFNLNNFQKMISELLRALKYLSSANVIHRDLKPDNLAIDGNGKLTLLDFGIARVIDHNNQHTKDPGQKYYRAIETIAFGQNDRQVYNEKADIWSIGAILCEMLTGTILFKNESGPDNPTITALAICGPIPENVIVEDVDDERSQEYLRARSSRAVRINFLDHFQQKGRSWMRDDIAREGAALVNFIDRTLAFDHRARMSVDEALAHSFLSAVREPEKEIVSNRVIADVGNASLEGWRQRIWDFVQDHPIM